MSMSPGYLGYLRQGASLGNTALGGNSPLGTLSSGLGIYNGLTSGTPQGEAGAAIGAGKLANHFGAFGNNSAAAGSALSGAAGALGLYGGIKQGGVAGDTQAALGAAQMAAPIASAVGSSLAPALAAAGPIGMALAPALIGMSTPAYSMPASYYQSLTDAIKKGPGTGWQSNVSGDSPEGLQYGNWISRISDAQLNGDPEEKAILAHYGISPTATTLKSMGLSYADADKGMGLNHLKDLGMNASRQVSRKAKGGHMASKPTSVLDQIRPSFKDVPHFDDGGGVSYYDSNNLYFTPTDYSGPSYDFNLDTPSNNDLSGFDFQQTNQQGVDSINNPYAGAQDSSSGGLGGVLSSLGMGSVGAALKNYGALAPIIAAALGGGNKPESAPSIPKGFTSGTTSPTLPNVNYNRTYTQPNVSNWYTYGQGPEQSFYNNNQIPQVAGTTPGNTGSAPYMANTQPVTTLRPSLMAHGGVFNSPAGDDYVADPGHGDGTSDDIDAKLSGGEYVMDAGTVSMLGNGSNEAGARALDQLRERVRKHAGKHLVKGKQFMKAKAPDAYLKGGK